jgi:16S rRNA (uracil1498-N3)-methyltransferase
MEYFYTPPHLVGTTDLTVEGDEFAHLTHVMRKMPGDIICVVDGNGTAYSAVIVDIGRHMAHCAITARHHGLHEPGRAVTLGVGLLKNPASFDYLVEKTTELGVTAIVPLLTERSILKNAKTERWKKLSLAAMKQSGRCVWPTVSPLATFSEFLARVAHSTPGIILHEQIETPFLKDAIPAGAASLVLCIGPEGGFSGEEVERATGAGFIAAGLGPRRLRTETAAVVAAAAALL